MRPANPLLAILPLAALFGGCVAPALGGDGTGVLGGAKDDLVLGGSFERNDVVSDAFFRDTELVDAADVQAWLEQNAWGGRTFLADETVGGVPFSTLIVDAARAEGVNPLMLLARMQAEKSLLSKTARPTSRNAVDFAFGCGCPDGVACNEAYRGLDRQVVCAAQTHDSRYADSVSQAGRWRRGHAERSLDGWNVTPANHATAALYAYTPHVGLSGGRVTGGNALFHNVIQRVVRHMIALGRITEADLPDARAPWVGTACASAADCDLGRTGARCAAFGGGGFCTVGCEGYCPDRGGHAPTFCVSLDGGATGSCVSKADPANGRCAGIPGTVAETRSRHLGGSGAPSSTATVCVPAMTDSPADDGRRCDDSCGFAENGVCDDESMGGAFSDCAPGTDCTDCGAARPAPTPEPTSCTDTCGWAGDGECDDGGPGSLYSVCELGTDCADCGAR